MTRLDRFNDATWPQIRAANPGQAAWVSANAGSGKTRVLTDRVSRLLIAGTPPQRILCITFTIAAASNMQNRLFAQLGEWSMLPDQELRERLLDLGEPEERLDSGTLSRARTLFASALETPGGLKIKTIHAFCSSLLSRFPLEAGVSPHFVPLDDRQARRMRMDVLSEVAEEATACYDAIVHEIAASQLADLVEEIASRREWFRRSVQLSEVYELFDIEQDKGIERNLCELLDRGLALAGDLAPHLELGSKMDQLAAQRAHGLPPEASIVAPFRRLPIFRKLSALFLAGPTARDPFGPKSRFPTKATRAGMEDELRSRLDAFMKDLSAARPPVFAAEAARKTVLLHEFASEFLKIYGARKQAGALLDFNDLIFRTLDLLTVPEAAEWVLYKLDGGIDHVLVDEAQDVSPAQWDIVARLAEEFTSGLGAGRDRRTVFAVGDEKQSIYGFQGAVPEKFSEMRELFGSRFREADKEFLEVGLHFSFRSARAVLEFVDSTFADEGGTAFADGINHIAFKEDLPGRVDLWPFMDDEGEGEESNWWQPAAAGSRVKPAIKLARRIADEIQCMIDDQVSIFDGNCARPITPGDILILVRRRSDLFYAIIQELKSAGLPIAGTDRLKLMEQLEIGDLNAFLCFLANTNDDLSLAAVLKSPLFALSEQELFTIAGKRDGRETLWQSLQQRRESFVETVRIIEDMLAHVDFLNPYELLERILTVHGGREKLVARLGTKIHESIDIYLQQALEYESDETVSLLGFLDWTADDTEVKRQLDQAGDEIRIMTVHGAKGLESPVVIVPDTAKRRDPQDGFVLLSDEGIPLWKTPKDESPPPVRQALARKSSDEANEQRRLLYVALTRAENWLIMCGAGRKSDDCWYAQIERGLEACEAQAHEFGTGDLEVGLRHETGIWPDSAPARAKAIGSEIELPAWATAEATQPTVGPRSWAPHGFGKETATHVPGRNEQWLDEENGRERGILTHLLLEVLPEHPRICRREMAENVLALGGLESVTPDTFEGILDECSKILDDDELQFLFGPGTVSEVPITAIIPERSEIPMLGVIDRLVVEDDRVMVVDYKSHSVVPSSWSETPSAILTQVDAYRRALRQIFPDKSVEAAILWTRTGELMMLPAID